MFFDLFADKTRSRKKRTKEAYEQTIEAPALSQNLPTWSQIGVHPAWEFPFLPTYPIAVAAEDAANTKPIIICISNINPSSSSDHRKYIIAQLEAPIMSKPNT